MRRNFDPIVLAAFRRPDDLLSEKSKRGFLRAAAWDSTRSTVCSGLIDSAAVVFDIWLQKLAPERAEQVRSLNQESIEAIAEYFAWMVLFCFRLANEIEPETNSLVLSFYDDLFPEKLGYGRTGFKVFHDTHKKMLPLDKGDLEGLDEADRWTVEHLRFLRPTATTLATLCRFGPTTRTETLGLEPDLGPTFNSAILHFGNAIGVRAKSLVPM